MSLRKYLLISILLVITLITGITVWSSYSESTHEVKELFDAQLARSARLMLGLTLIEIRDGGLKELQSMILRNRLRLDEHKYEDVEMVLTKEPIYEMKLAFQVWDNQGNMILRSGNAPLYPLTQQASGYSEQSIGDTHWRIFSLWNDDYSYQVMAAERNEVREELIDSITWRLVLPFIIMFPALAGLVWLAIGWGLTPLSRVAGEVKSRNIHNLEALDVETVPEEVKPLVLELNWLFTTLKESFEKERRFTSDAAHE
ncbi:MAG: sensor histidine kinase N-terminal domain-containing protein, partial [Gammaproteobacteria bacterium]|nr:sensor histidine kinase N-terminal domain-containing protein [Gammaproteobacteria bacterium]